MNATQPIPASRCIFLLLLMALLVAGAGTAQAKKDDKGRSSLATEQGGYTGPGPDLVTVKQALDMNDDARVALKGTITKSLGGKEYTFADSSGSVTVKIGRKAWRGQEVGPKDTVEIRGEVEKKMSGTYIDVKRLIKQ